MKKSLLLTLVVICIMSLAMVLTACGGTTAPADTGDAAGDAGDATDEVVRVPEGAPTIVIASKTFTENILLGQLTYDYLKYLGYPVEDQLGFGEMAFLRAAMESGEISMYWEYDGTCVMAIMQVDPIFDPDLCYQTAKEWDAENNDVIWLDKADLNDTYAFVVRQETADEYNLKTFSDMVTLMQGGQKFILGSGEEYVERADGLPHVEEVYGFSFPRTDYVNLVMGLSIEALKNKEVDWNVANSTEPKIITYNLAVLEDDKQAFPPYYAAPTIRKDVLDAYPMLEADMKTLSSVITTDNMTEMIGFVDLDNMTEEEVSQNFLKEKGLIQ